MNNYRFRSITYPMICVFVMLLILSGALASEMEQPYEQDIRISDDFVNLLVENNMPTVESEYTLTLQETAGGNKLYFFHRDIASDVTLSLNYVNGGSRGYGLSVSAYDSAFLLINKDVYLMCFASAISGVSIKESKEILSQLIDSFVPNALDSSREESSINKNGFTYSLSYSESLELWYFGIY